MVDHLFRHEAGRMVAALIRTLGTKHLSLAEDVVQDVLCAALESWKFGRVPENPAAWLMRAARNRAIDLVRRGALHERVAPELQSEWTLVPAVDALFDEHLIRDDDLRLIFSCCDPSLSPDSQLAITLRYPCGFSVAEIARAFLASEAAVEKRLVRARETLAARGELFDVRSAEEVRARLDIVHDALYLLFNEGYHGAHPQKVVREELCYEALRLALRLLELPEAATPKSRALVALMCFHAARLESRITEGTVVRLGEQDRSRWDRSLITQGERYLDAACEGAPSAFHFEAGIARIHCAAETFDETDWPAIVTLYDRLLAMRPSPVVALNRAVAVGMAQGPREGLAALRDVDDARLSAYPFLAAAFGELHERLGDRDAARARFEEARRLARSDAEAAFFARRAAECA